MTSRLDVMIYCHDGRGLGHASRGIAIGMALRRLAPDLKVLLVTGCSFSQTMIGTAPLDWLKLPSYATRVRQGQSTGVAGNAGFGDKELGEIRARHLLHLVRSYQPRLILVDHTPQGKHRELIPALTESSARSLWVLGVRGILGEVDQAKSHLAQTLFTTHYRALLWYGDSVVLGQESLQALHAHYGMKPRECGYVVRLAEFCHWSVPGGLSSTSPAGVVSIPWLGENTAGFTATLLAAVGRISADFGSWHVYIGTQGVGADILRDIEDSLAGFPHIELRPLGHAYVESLIRAQVAVICGGYNSLMDCIHTRTPAVVVVRDMRDREQQLHLQKLGTAMDGGFSVISETAATVEGLEQILRARLQMKKCPASSVNTNGAATSARYLCSLLAEI